MSSPRIVCEVVDSVIQKNISQALNNNMYMLVDTRPNTHGKVRTAVYKFEDGAYTLESFLHTAPGLFQACEDGRLGFSFFGQDFDPSAFGSKLWQILGAEEGKTYCGRGKFPNKHGFTTIVPSEWTMTKKDHHGWIYTHTPSKQFVIYESETNVDGVKIDRLALDGNGVTFV